MNEELNIELNEIKRNVIKIFKHQKYLELNEELKKLNRRDAEKRLLINAKLVTLKYDPNIDGENIMDEEEIQSKVKELIGKIEEREVEFINTDGESSMLCELSVKNFINFLKHFKVNIDFTQFQQHYEDEDNNNENKEMKEENEKMKEQLRIFGDRIFVNEHNLKLKVCNLFYFIILFCN